MAVKLNSPLVGAGIGGGTSLAVQAVLKFAVKDTTSEFVKSLQKWSGPVAFGVGLLPAAALFFTKNKSAAIGAAIGDAIASAPAIVADVLAAKSTAATTTGNGTTTGTTQSPAGTEPIRGFGAFAVQHRRREPVRLLSGQAGPVRVLGLPGSVQGFGRMPTPGQFGTESTRRLG